MLSPAVLFTAITLVCFISEIYCDPASAQDIDFRSILDLAQQQNSHNDKEVDRYESSSDEEDRKHYGSLKSQEIVELLQKATQDSEWQGNRNDDEDAVQLKKGFSNKKYYKELSENNLNDGLLYDYQLNAKKRDKYKDDYERHDHRQFNEEALEQLLSQNVLDKSQSKQRQKLVPNDLVGSIDFSNDRTEDRDDLGAYSKVYVVLNSEAIAKSDNKDKLNNLLTKILSLTSSRYGLDQERKTRERRYKGFPLMQRVLSRRVRRGESREAYGKDSIEEDYRPKRVRSERVSGGGGTGGRTAIPYIRQRGDIYERDN